MGNHWSQGYTCLPNNFGDDVKKDSHLRVLFKIMTFHYCDEKKLSSRYLSKITGKSIATVREAMIELEGLGYVEKLSSGDHCEAAVYRMNMKFVMSRTQVPDNNTQRGVLNSDTGGVSNSDTGGVSKFDTKELNIKRSKHKEKREGDDIESEPEKIVKKWNSKESLPPCEESLKLFSSIGKLLVQKEKEGIYPLDILNAIDNFSEVKGCSQTWFKGYYGLASFLGINNRKGVFQRFLSEFYDKKEYVNSNQEIDYSEIKLTQHNELTKEEIEDVEYFNNLYGENE